MVHVTSLKRDFDKQREKQRKNSAAGKNFVDMIMIIDNKKLKSKSKESKSHNHTVANPGFGNTLDGPPPFLKLHYFLMKPL